MSIIKNEIPILEFDTDQSAVIMSAHEKLGIRLPPWAVFAFLGEEVERYAASVKAVPIAYFESETKLFPAYVISYKGEPVTLIQAPVGAAAAVQILDWLWAYGTEKVISAGCCGALRDYGENVFLVPRKALRDEGASYHYAPPSRFIEVDPRARAAIEKTLTDHGLKYTEVVTWSTDGFYRETKAMVEYRKQEGCDVVEMECSALSACAAMRGIIWGELLYTADTLVNVHDYDVRNWGRDSVSLALELCLEAVLKL